MSKNKITGKQYFYLIWIMMEKRQLDGSSVSWDLWAWCWRPLCDVSFIPQLPLLTNAHCDATQKIFKDQIRHVAQIFYNDDLHGCCVWHSSNMKKYIMDVGREIHWQLHISHHYDEHPHLASGRHTGYYRFKQWLVAYPAPIHCLNLCCFVVDWALRNKHK